MDEVDTKNVTFAEWSAMEEEMLKSLIEENKTKLLERDLQVVTRAERTQLWLLITETLNAHPDVVPKSKQQVQDKWKNMRRIHNNRMKRIRAKTGGDNISPGSMNIVGDDGYDKVDDAVHQNDNIPVSRSKKTKIEKQQEYQDRLTAKANREIDIINEKWDLKKEKLKLEIEKLNLEIENLISARINTETETVE